MATRADPGGEGVDGEAWIGADFSVQANGGREGKTGRRKRGKRARRKRVPRMTTAEAGPECQAQCGAMADGA